MTTSPLRARRLGPSIVAAAVLLLAAPPPDHGNGGALGALRPGSAAASRDQWSVFDDPIRLTKRNPTTALRTLREIQALGADTIRVAVRWATVAPRPNSKRKPRFNSEDPSAYPGFTPFDFTIRMASSMGLRVIVTVTGDSPRWSKVGRRAQRGYVPKTREFADFATAVARRYSGAFAGLPKVDNFIIWNEPNWPGMLAPQSTCRRGRCSPAAAHNYRRLVRAAYPAIKRANRDAFVMIGELAPSGKDDMGPHRPTRPLRFLRAMACRDARYRRIRGGPCRGFRPAMGDAISVHPYSIYARSISPYSGSPARDDASIGDSRRFFATLDRLTRLGGLRVGDGRRRFSVYHTEFGTETNPPNRDRGVRFWQQAEYLNLSEEVAYRNSRIKSYAQYQLYDEGRFRDKTTWQAGLRRSRGRKKPAYYAYKFPIVVHRRRRSVVIWGRVRPGSGHRSVQLERERGSRWVRESFRVRTDRRGYFRAKRHGVAAFRFKAYSDTSSRAKLIGSSRNARPTR